MELSQVQGRWLERGGRLRAWWGALLGNEAQALRGAQDALRGAILSRPPRERRLVAARIDALLIRIDARRAARVRPALMPG